MGFAKKWLGASLVLQIACGIVLGVFFALIAPSWATQFSLVGGLFVQALKAVAPILVFVLVMSSIANQRADQQTHMKPVLLMYAQGTVCAALVAVALSYAFPLTLQLNLDAVVSKSPQHITEVLGNVLSNAVVNPIAALMNSNFIGILVWAVVLGVALHKASDTTKQVLSDVSDAVSSMVHLVIRFAPLGVMGLVAGTVASTGFSALASFAHLLGLLLGGMLIVALLVNPLLVWLKTRENPYPLVFVCLRESGVTAFFTRSSAANIPVNLALCKKLDLHEDTYSVSIPLGATINMAGAAITITVLSLAAVHTLGIQIDVTSAILLSLLAAVSACGASGVAGGSLLLIPLACSLFGIPNDVAMQVVAVGFIVGVLQDSAETALNSSTDVVFTAAVCRDKA